MLERVNLDFVLLERKTGKEAPIYLAALFYKKGKKTQAPEHTQNSRKESLKWIANKIKVAREIYKEASYPYSLRYIEEKHTETRTSKANPTKSRKLVSEIEALLD